MHLTPYALTLMLATSFAAGASPAQEATHSEHQHSTPGLDARGAAAMGFAQTAAVHHFTLTPSGGDISVAAKDPADQATIAQIRAHLTAIAREFAAGAFTAPLATHGEPPAGTATLQARRSHLRYTYREAPGGGRVEIRTSDAAALAAVHDFLRYQIREHATGDSLEIQKKQP